ncbi:MAG: hypothetical protein ACREFK_16910 [Stellaceae bacterium]
MTRAPPPCETSAECLRRLNRLLIRAVKALGEEGQTDLVCRIAPRPGSPSARSARKKPQS